MRQRASRIDFAAGSPWRWLWRLSPWVGLCGGIGLLLCAGAAWQGWLLLGQWDAVQAAARQAGARAAAQVPTRAEPPPVTIAPAQADAVNAAVLQLNLPWRDLLDALEDATPASIALLALEPDTKKRVLKAEAEGRTPAEMIAYVEALKRQGFFHTVRVTRHDIGAQDPGRPVRFQLEADWDNASVVLASPAGSTTSGAGR